MGVEYRGRLFEKTSLALIADGSDDNPINIEGMEGDFFMDAEGRPEPLEDVLPASPAPAEEKHPPGSSVEGEKEDEEGGNSNSDTNDELATLDVHDDRRRRGAPAARNPHGVHPSTLSACGTHRGTREDADSAAVGYRVAQGGHHAAGTSTHPPPPRRHTEFLSAATAAHTA